MGHPARKMMPMPETETPDIQIEHYQWKAIHQASRLLEKIDERWPTKVSEAAATS
jgi:hypothetical protein